MAGTQVKDAASGLLAATSILTGFTFSMAVVFWNKSIDARRDPLWSADGPAIALIDRTRTHLIFTVMVGVAAVATLTLATLFTGVEIDGMAGDILTGALRVANAAAAGLVIYLISLVALALRDFNEAFFVLRP